MRALVQRVKRASVSVAGDTVARVGSGLCVLVGVTHGDDERSAAKLAEKVFNLRVMEGAEHPMDRSVGEVGGAVLVVSQFTLYGDTARGRRPSWAQAAPPQLAESLIDAFADRLSELGAEVATGTFGARMDVELVNDGPVTLLLEA